MRIPSLDELIETHADLMERSGGLIGIRDSHGLESAASQPEMTFGGHDLYPTLVDKAAALAFSLVKNHPFIDGNKRIGHAAMELMLDLNGYELVASDDEQEALILSLAAGTIDRETFTTWVREHCQPRKDT